MSLYECCNKLIFGEASGSRGNPAGWVFTVANDREGLAEGPRMKRKNNA